MTRIESKMFSVGAYTPDQFATIQNVFRDVVSEPWFTSSAERQKEFAVLVIQTYRRGMICPERLLEFCRAAARESFQGHETAILTADAKMASAEKSLVSAGV